MGWWRNIYYYLGIYDYYPENIDIKDVANKNNMLVELKTEIEKSRKFEYRIIYEEVLAELVICNQLARYYINKNIII